MALASSVSNRKGEHRGNPSNSHSSKASVRGAASSGGRTYVRGLGGTNNSPVPAPVCAGIGHLQVKSFAIFADLGLSLVALDVF